MSGIRTWVIVPGFQIKDIPIVTALDGGDSHTTNMLYMKHISPSIPPPQDYYTSYLTSACSFPNTSSMEAASCPTTRDFDHMYVRYELSSFKVKKTSTIFCSLSRVDTSALMAEKVHLKEMLVTHLDLIQQQVRHTLSCSVFLSKYL